MVDYYLRLVELPVRVEGVTLPNSDGSFNIYINSLLSEDKRRQVLAHELRHIEKEHFYLDMSVRQMERQAGGENPNAALHPPRGMLAHFSSEDDLAFYVRRLLRQQGIHL